MGNQLAETLVGAVVLVVAALFLTYSLGVSGRGATGGYEVRAEFASVEGLSRGAEVRLSGVRIGAVSDITLDPETYQAEVRLRLDRNVPLPADSTLMLQNEGLLGGVFLAFEPGAEMEMLAAGDQVIYTQGAVDIWRLLQDLVAGLTSD